MSLDENSTIADAERAYRANLSYSTDGSATKARLFVEACRYLLAFTPKSINHQGDSLNLNPELIRDEMRGAMDWLSTHSDATTEGGPRVTKGSFRNFR